MTIFAFTEHHNDYPAYVNISEHPDGTIKLSVRTRGNGGRDYASIGLSKARAEELAEAIFKNVYKDEQDMPAPAHPVAGAAVAKGPTDDDIRDVAINYAAHVAADIYNITKYDCAEDFFNCVRAICAKHTADQMREYGTHSYTRGRLRAIEDYKDVRANIAAQRAPDTHCRWPMCESKEVQDQAEAAEALFRPVPAAEAQGAVAYMHELAEGTFGDTGFNTQILMTEDEANTELAIFGGTIKPLYTHAQPTAEEARANGNAGEG